MGLGLAGSVESLLMAPCWLGPTNGLVWNCAAVSGLSAGIASERSATVSAEKAGSIVGLSRLLEKPGCTYLITGHPWGWVK